jgi:hypothetical protein
MLIYNTTKAIITDLAIGNIKIVLEKAKGQEARGQEASEQVSKLHFCAIALKS